MKRTVNVVGMSVLVATAILQTGCTVTIRPTVSQSEFLTNSQKAPIGVALYLTDEFRSYKFDHLDWWCDARNYAIQFGPFASDWFRYGLENRFENVVAKSGEPSFPVSDAGVDFVVTPEITSFKAGGPWVVKFEEYWVEVGMKIAIQDRQGKVLETLEMQQKGARGGSIGLEPGSHIYPDACRRAIEPLVNQTIDKIIELANQK